MAPQSEEDVTHRIDRDLLAFPPPWEAGSLATGWGLTKREVFAAMAMQGLATIYPQGGDFMETHVAQGAVKIADALLNELAK